MVYYAMRQDGKGKTFVIIGLTADLNAASSPDNSKAFSQLSLAEEV